jgi:enoyl-CoA hydratase
MADELVHVTVADGVARVELDKPPVNAFDLPLVEALDTAVAQVRESGARVAVFSGRGPSLAAGGDIKWVYARTTERDEASLTTFFTTIQRVFEDIERLPMPTIAVVQGMTLGGGFEIALACDLRVMADDAQVGFPEATIGLLPGAGGTQRITELVGRARALELMYSGKRLTAADAHGLGIVNRVASADGLDAAAEALVAEVLRATPAAAAAIKRCVAGGIESGRHEGFRLEQELVAQLAFDPDSVQRLTDFVERKGASKPQPATAATATGSEGA